MGFIKQLKSSLGYLIMNKYTDKELDQRHVRAIKSCIEKFRKGDQITIHISNIYNAIIGEFLEFTFDADEVSGILTYHSQEENQTCSFKLIESVKWV
ncbi:hypothetical protein [Leptospira alstonii]|uniref:hypothetical protein n=1 Tax=Leptospira alstonii TaxID=28452 RepID=UPI000562565E|nr:hypothetical protein [Leptospira alstonii]